MIGAGCERARQQTGVTTVALSGGVFQNTLLTRLTKERLERAGFRVLLNSLLPPNDGARREVSAELLSDIAPGDYVMVHAGLAIAKITAEDAEETEALLRDVEDAE